MGRDVHPTSPRWPNATAGLKPVGRRPLKARCCERRPMSPDTGLLHLAAASSFHGWSGDSHRCSLRGRWLRERFSESYLACSPGRDRGRHCLALVVFRRVSGRPVAARGRDGGACAANRRAVDRRPGGDRCRADRPRRADQPRRTAAAPCRRRAQRQRRAGPGERHLPAWHQHQPCGVADRRRARQLRHHRHQRTGARAAVADRAHRGAARPGQQPVRGRRDRRRDPDLHPHGRWHPRQGGRRQRPVARAERRHRARGGRHLVVAARGRQRRRGVLGDQLDASVLVQPGR